MDMPIKKCEPQQQQVAPNGVPGVKQPERRILSSVDAVKAFFKEKELPYDEKQSRYQNILANIHRLPPDTKYLVVFEGIIFDVPNEVTYTFPDNYRLKKCTLVGKGALAFTSDAPDSTALITIESVNDLEKVLGLYYTERSIIENIKQAEKMGNFPTGDISFQGMTLNLENNGSQYTLPKNVHLDCFIEIGHLIFSNGKLTVTKPDAIAEANGCLAEAHTNVGRVYARNQASAYATGTGVSFALTDSSVGYADGKDAKAFGMQNGSIIVMTNGATGYQHVRGVIAKKDNQSAVGWTVVHQEKPDCYNPRKTEKGSKNYQQFQQYLNELLTLAKLEDAEAAFKLGMEKNAVLDVFFEKSDFSKEVNLLRKAHKSGHQEAAYQLGELELAKGKEGYQSALAWYVKARDKTSAKDVEDKISILTLALALAMNVVEEPNHDGFVVTPETTKYSELPFMLGMSANNALKLVFKELDNPKLHFLTEAFNSGHTEAAYQLGEHFSSIGELETALGWYYQALDASKQKKDASKQGDIEQKIVQIRKKLSDEKCTIS